MNEDEVAIARLDRAMEIQGRRIIRLSTIAKLNPKVFLAHIRKVLKTITKKDYQQYVREVRFLHKSLPDEDMWAEHQKAMSYSTKGFMLYLLLRMNDKDYPAIMEAAGLEASYLDKLIRQRAEEVYIPRKKWTPPPEPENTTEHRTVPTDTHKVPNDKDTFGFFEQTDKHVKAGQIQIKENPKAKAEEQTYSIIKFGNKDGGTFDHRFNGFDKAVLSALYSLSKAGNDVTTIDTMYAHMNGRAGRLQPSAKMRDRILSSIRAMAMTWVVLEFDVKDKLRYKRTKKRDEGNLLSAEIQSTIINGVPVECAIFIKGFSPFVKLAEAKRQILAYPMELLNVPVSCTEDTIIMREELLRRIEAMKKHGQSKIIVLAEVFSGIGYAKMDKQQKRRCIDKAVKMMDYWKKEGYIFDYKIVKQKQTPVKFDVQPHEPKGIGGVNENSVQPNAD